MVSVFCLAASGVYAKPKEKSAAKGRAEGQKTAAERVGNEIADSMTDVLTGEDSKKASTSSSKNGNTPPGLAKKGKTPPEREKGQNAGRHKNEKAARTEEDSPVKSLIKGLLKKDQSN